MNGTKMKNNFQKVTVVTVTYNAEKYLEQTIKSVIEQDYPNIEYIIIDGASSDGTIDIIKKYESYITYWISEPDSGIYDAMNKGIDAATGEWINFMNAGDSFSSNNILTLISTYFPFDYEMIYGGFNFVDQFNNLSYNQPLDLSYIWEQMPCCHQSVFIKTSVMKHYKYDTKYKINSDLDLLLKIYTNKHKYKYTNLPFSNFLYGGIHTQDNPRRYLDEIYITSRYMKECKNIYNHQSYKNMKLEDPNFRMDSKILYKIFNILLDRIEYLNNNYKFIIIYGNSSIAKIIVKFIKIEYKIADINSEVDTSTIINPKNINNYPYEIIVNSLIDRNNQVTDFLTTLNIDKAKIYCLDLNIS